MEVELPNRSVVMPTAPLALRPSGSFRASNPLMDSVREESTNEDGEDSYDGDSVMHSVEASSASLIRNRHRRKATAFMQAVFAILGVILTVAHSEIGITSNFDADIFECRRGRVAVTPSCAMIQQPAYPFTSNLTAINILRGLCSATVIGLLGSLVYHWYLVHQYLIMRNTVSSFSTVFTLPEGGYMMAELLICVIHVPPGIEEITTHPGVPVFLTLVSLLRLYTVARMYYMASFITSPSARFIGTLTTVRFDSMFVIKSWLAVRPIVALATVAGIVLLVLAYGLRFTETIFCLDDPFSQCDPRNIVDSLWILVLTITTVGYGLPDVAFSDAGRILSVFSAVLGVFLVLVYIALAILSMEPTPAESNVLCMWDNIRRTTALREAAAKTLQAFFRYRLGFKQSITWKTGMCGMQYRDISERIPLERAFNARTSLFGLIRTQLRQDAHSTEAATVSASTAEGMLFSLDAIRGQLDSCFDKLAPSGMDGKTLQRRLSRSQSCRSPSLLKRSSSPSPRRGPRTESPMPIILPPPPVLSAPFAAGSPAGRPRHVKRKKISAAWVGFITSRLLAAAARAQKSVKERA